MTERDDFGDLRDGLTRKERVILYCLNELQTELNGRNVPTVMLYGRVVEMIDIGQDEFMTILARFANK